MKRLLLIALASCLPVIAVRGDEGQDITVNPVVLDDGYMAVNQGAFWPTLDGAWSLNLNPNVGSIQSFPFTLTGTAVALNPSVSPFDIAGYAAVSDIVDMDLSGMYGGNWLAWGVRQLRLRIEREGYSAGVMADCQSLKAQLDSSK